jgi:MSHA type pilus biogenesis protein MshL
MRKKRVSCALLVLAFLTLQGCGDNIATTSKIDPAGGLTRDDYLALRHRGEEAMVEPPPPPIPDMPNTLPLAVAPGLGHDKLVSVTVSDNVPLRDVLIELAREAKVNLELDPRVEGGIIFSAHDQPFDEVLRRICNLAGLRAKTEGNFVHIEMDDAYQETYQLDYLSLARRSSSETSIATNVFDVDVTNGSSGASGNSSASSSNGAATQNNSLSKISGTSEADFWSEVEKSVTQILASTGKKSAKETATNFSIDRQAGMVTVYGDSRQQTAVSDYFQKLKRKAYAQVLIDARIIEVELSDEFKSGINWRTLFSGAFNAAANFGPAAAAAPFLTATSATSGVFTAAVNNHDFAGILNFVRTFGTTRVLSAPRLTVLNNQTAMLKVATNQVYFVTQAQFTTVTNANGSAVTTTPVYTSTPRTVPVGLVMTVQPAIDVEHNRITMTLRPTVSRVVGQVDDPSIGLNAAQAGVNNPVESQIPVLAVREMDSVIQMRSGEVAVMGGLMQDQSINTDAGVPGLDETPIVGILAKSRDNQGITTELVILLRATIAAPPAPDMADVALYRRYNDDPRPLPLPAVATDHAQLPSVPPPPPTSF